MDTLTSGPNAGGTGQILRTQVAGTLLRRKLQHTRDGYLARPADVAAPTSSKTKKAA